MARRNQRRVRHPRIEQPLNNLSRRMLIAQQVFRAVEIFVEIALRFHPLRFHFRRKSYQPVRRRANIFKRVNACVGHVADGLFNQVADQHVQHALYRFVEHQLFRRARKSLLHGNVEALENAHVFANMLDGQDPRFHSIVKVRGQVGNLVREIDQLGFKRRPLC